MGNDRKNEIVAEMSNIRRVAGLRKRMWGSDIRRELGIEPLLLYVRQKGPAEVVQASDQDASRAPPIGGLPGTSNWQEAPR